MSDNKTFLMIFVTVFAAILMGFALDKLTSTDYQINIKGESVTLYDGSRLVGKCPINKLDSLIINDNQ